MEEEADEALYWMELLMDAGPIEERRLLDLMQEGDELLSIIVASIKTARSNGRSKAAT